MRESRGQVLRPTALGADAGKQEHRLGHQLPKSAEIARLGRPDHGAQARDPAPRRFTGKTSAARGDHLRKPLVQGRLRRRQVEEVRGAGIRGAHQSEDAGTRPACRLDENVEGIAAKERGGGECVRLQTRHRPPGRRRGTDHRLAIGGRADGDIAALAVGDDEQAGFPRRPDGPLECPPTRSSEALEAGQLRLDHDTGGSGLLDQLPAVVSDRGRGEIGRGGVGRYAPPGAEPRRVGIETEADAARARGDRRREPIGEGGRAVLRGG